MATLKHLNITHQIMTRIFLPIIAILSFAVLVSARQYYYAPLGPWGLESTVIHAKSIRNKDAELHKVHTVSEKKNAKKEEVDEVGDELEKAEEAFFHAVEEVEHAVEHAIDDEVETLFPHHKKTKED